MIYNYDKLEGKIKEKLGCNANLGVILKLSERTISQKLNSVVDFKQTEILNICNALEINKEEIPLYFFETKTQLN